MPRTIKPNDLCSHTALIAAGKTKMCKQKGEYDTEFVKRIVAAYLNAIPESEAQQAEIAAMMGGKKPWARPARS